MDSKIIFFSISLLFSSAAAIDITTVLDGYPDFSTFNRYLTQTHVADIINSRQPPITLLVVHNSNISPLSDKAPDVLKKIMMAHVVLDYFDAEKLKKLQDKSVLATTLLQTTGEAVENQGYLNITDLSSGNVVFGSAAKGATLGSDLVMSVVSQPYDLSVVQISNVIVPLGIENSTNTNTNFTSANSTSPSSPPVVPPPTPTPSNTPAAASPTNTTAASSTPAMPPAASPTNASTASPTKPPVASPTKPPSASPTKAPTASPIMPPAPSPRKMLSPAKSPSNAPDAAPNSPPPMSIAGTPAPTSKAPTKDDDTSSPSVGTALGVSAGVIAANLFLVLMMA